jgi:hypothetical protein
MSLQKMFHLKHCIKMFYKFFDKETNMKPHMDITQNVTCWNFGNQPETLRFFYISA